MKKMIIPLFLFSAFFSGCKNNPGGEAMAQNPDTLMSPQPKVDIRVNKQYDDAGNLVRMDSTYIWSYSNLEGDSVKVAADSLLEMFKPFSFGAFPDTMDLWLNPFFNFDSIFYTDFFRDNYFFDRWHREFKSLERELHKLDSLRDEFLKREYPGMKQPKKKGSGITL